MGGNPFTLYGFLFASFFMLAGGVGVPPLAAAARRTAALQVIMFDLKE